MEIWISHIIATVHKSQGSEYEYLVIVLPGKHAGMLDQKPSLYGCDRQRRRSRIIYENDALQKAIRTSKKRGTEQPSG